jgi:alginate O-acetyltransferase complex protein AlgI
MGAIAFSLQIYFDFSGYSDMAIGLGRMFGFHFLENFNYPFISKSITEFWRRWHMSLGTWFKDYVYIPLGGNKGSRAMWFRNIGIVWLLTGLWHGASWNFVFWGLYFGVILALEKLVLSKVLLKWPIIFRHVYVLLLVIISFVIFNHESLTTMMIQFKGMFGTSSIPLVNEESIYYLKSYSIIFLFAMIGATPLIKSVFVKGYEFKRIKTIMDILEAPFYATLLLIVTGYLVDSSFNPFLYFRF